MNKKIENFRIEIDGIIYKSVLMFQAEMTEAGFALSPNSKPIRYLKPVEIPDEPTNSTAG